MRCGRGVLVWIGLSIDLFIHFFFDGDSLRYYYRYDRRSTHIYKAQEKKLLLRGMPPRH